MAKLTKLLSAAALCAVVTVPVILSTAADARVVVGVGINLTPPPPRVEVRPVAPWRDGVWIDGHWGRRDGQWEWIPGHWARPMGHYTRWVPGRYLPNGVWVEGHWR
jgi:YXWGXW repeat-containing protein